MSDFITFKYDIEIPQGATFDQSFTWTADGVAVDLSSVTAAKAQLRTDYDAAEALVEVTLAGGGIAIAAAQGTVRLVLSAAATAVLPAGWGVYDVELTWADGSTQRFLQGRFQVTPEVTK